MPKKTRVTAREYHSLSLNLKRAKIHKNHGILARLLLEIFGLDNNEGFNAARFEAAKLTSTLNFTALRKKLKDANWIRYQQREHATFLYEPGAELTSYIESFIKHRSATLQDLRSLDLKVTNELSQKANQSDVTALQADVASIKTQINEILIKIRELSAPPPNREKQIEILKQTELLQKLTGTTSSTLWDN